MLVEYFSARGEWVRYNGYLGKAYLCTARYTVSVCPKGAGFAVGIAFIGDPHTYRLEGMSLGTVTTLLDDMDGEFALAEAFYGLH